MTDQLPITEFPTKPNRLPPESTAARRAALKARKAFTTAMSPFVRIMREAMDAYREARAQGVERADAIKGLEFTLRESWPKHVSKFKATCDLCDDTGYQEFICRPYARCERELCVKKGEDFQHRYVRPCECEKGRRFAPKVWQPVDAQASIGKVTKPKRGFSRVGNGHQ